jgi:hypothetical protein
MFFAGTVRNGQMQLAPLQLSGVGFGDQNIAALQQALANLATKTLRPLANPGPITGELNDQTMQALYNSTDLFTSKLSTWEAVTIKGALLLGASSTEAKNIIAQHAAAIAAAVVAATAEYQVNAPPLSVFQTVETNWPVALLVVAGLALIGYRLFFAPPTVKQ